MGALIDSYLGISKQIQTLNDKISRTEAEIAQLSSAFTGDSSARIAKLEEQLVKIDDYLLKIRGFQELAQRNLDSQNVLTIEAPPGYRVNLNRLRNWAMMIDPQSSNDPYAQRVYVVAKCDECFLKKKQAEFLARIDQLKAELENGTSAEITDRQAAIAAYRAELSSLARSEAVSSFGRDVLAENKSYQYIDLPASYRPGEAPAFWSPGAYSAPLDLGEEQSLWLKTGMGECYDSESRRVLLPVELDSRKEFVMTVSCNPSRRKRLDRALQHFVLSQIDRSPVGSRKVYVLDAVRYNTTSMGSLRELENSSVMARIPRNPELLTAALEEIVSGFADIDDLLELQDSVSEYNAGAEPGKQIPLSTVIVFGWPDSFTGRDKELLQRILTNYERYGISLVIVSYPIGSKQPDTQKEQIPAYAMQNAVRITMTQNDNTIEFPGGTPQRFVWYALHGELSREYVDSVLQSQPVRRVVGNEYPSRYSLTELPPYVRQYKKLELPFGIDGKDQPHSISFENENFATYLVGASRSGKSTLLHILIAGLIRNYHPDNVELWLADFKQLEFKHYIKYLPPHVKYVLLDESTELVYDLIDKLSAQMMERQKLFARLGVQRIDQVDPTGLDKPLPVIFVILDEFSIMSQSIAESPVYKLRLQNLLAKGAALGIRFLFSSQTFTTGVAGLTPTARAQIQQRISMKGSKEEISETLELSANLKTEKVRNWMDALPPFYALVKYRMSADTLPEVKRVLVMYFKDYAPRNRMIESIRSRMHPVETYDPADLSAYVDKHPVLVDGNSYDAFDRNAFLGHIREVRKSPGSNMVGDETLVAFGTPRLMERMKVAALSSETRENILLVARAAEQPCAASILLSCIGSFFVQHGKVEIWAYSKNSLYRTYKEAFISAGAAVVEDMDDVCAAISGMKADIMQGRADNKLILLVGMERICMDFDFIAPAAGAPVAVQEKMQEYAAAAVVSEEDMRKKAIADAFARIWSPVEAALTKEGKSPDEIRLARKEKVREFKSSEEYARIMSSSFTAPAPVPAPVPAAAAPASGSARAYNAKADFEFIFKQGSRLGYHFLLDLTNFSDLRSCGLKPDYMRYRLAFQSSVDDSRSIFGTKVASTLPEHICQYSDGLEQYSFRPYLHKDVGWDGWSVDDSGKVVSPYGEDQ